jgi:hypothetical protein
MPGGRSTHASVRSRRSLNNTKYGGGNKKYGLPSNVGMPVMLSSYIKNRTSIENVVEVEIKINKVIIDSSSAVTVVLNKSWDHTNYDKWEKNLTIDVSYNNNDTKYKSDPSDVYVSIDDDNKELTFTFKDSPFKGVSGEDATTIDAINFSYKDVIGDPLNEKLESLKLPTEVFVRTDKDYKFTNEIAVLEKKIASDKAETISDEAELASIGSSD